MKEQVDMLFCIPVGNSEHQYQRIQACEETWIRDLSAYPEERCRYFYIRSAPELYYPKLEGNTLWVPCEDGYYFQIQEKIHHFLRWALDHFEFRHIFKCDPDTYIFMDRLMMLFEIYKDNPFFGYAFWAFDGIPSFPSGGAGYAVNQEAAKIMANGTLGKYGPEEQDFAAILYNDANITLTHVEGLEPGLSISTHLEQWLETPLYSTIHYASPDIMRYIHERAKSPETLPLTRIGAQAKHPHWRSPMYFLSNKRFYRPYAKAIEGIWNLVDNQLELKWYIWDLEVLTLDNDYKLASGKNGDFQIEFEVALSQLLAPSAALT